MANREGREDGGARGDTDGLQWYILVTAPLAEAAVARRLKRRLGGRDDPEHGDVLCDAVATFVPIARWSQKLHGRTVQRERVVFPRYLFAGFAGLPDWLALREVTGLHGLVTQDGAPYRVAAETVGLIIARCETGWYRPAPEPMVQRGMRVAVRAGRFRGMEGDVVGIDRRQGRADVLMELFDAATMRLRLDDLVSVSYSDVRMTG